MKRSLCPIHQNDAESWNVLGHQELLSVLSRHDLFSSAVSQHPAVPNGMDPPQHTAYRRIIEAYFTPSRIDAFEPVCRALTEIRWASLSSQKPVEILQEFARPLALDIQCAFVGWPKATREPLERWLTANQAAQREQNRERLSQLASEFENIVGEQLALRRQNDPNLCGADATTRLMREEIDGRRLTSQEITSILRNWTVGELGTIASSIGILAGFLARDLSMQSRLRDRPETIPYAIEEALRIQAPLWSNRRVVSRTTTLGGQIVRKGQRLTLLWGAANQDPKVFKNPTRFEEDRDQSRNLLYGSGIHVCPGASLARLELRVAVEVMLKRCREIQLAEPRGELAHPPATGWSTLWLKLAES